MNSKTVVFHVVSIFPQTVENYCGESILKRGKDKNLVDFKFYNLRDFTFSRHGKIDDKPYGGGPGMVMSVQPIVDCVEKILRDLTDEKVKKSKIKTILFKPGGEKFTNVVAKKYANKYTNIILICGRYEGIDYRVEEILKPEVVSIGDYVLTGGEIPAMAVIDAVSRQVKGVLGDFFSLEDERVEAGGSIEEFYTRPEIYEKQVGKKIKKYKVPEVFLSGNPKLISEYKYKKKS